MTGRRTGAAAAGAVALAALWLAGVAGVKHFGAVPAAAQTAGAMVLLFGAPGYPLARWLLPERMLGHLQLLVLPIGAVAAALSLAVLGFAGLPLTASLVVVISAGLAAGLWFRATRGPARTDAGLLDEAGESLTRLAWPALLAGAVTAIALIPMFRADRATLTGQNGDSVLAVGVGEFLQKNGPRETDTPLFADRMTDNWRSKYPIYYALAGVSRLSGLRVEQAFPTVIAAMLGLTAIGFMGLAFHVLSAGAVGALLAMALTGLDRILLYLALGPFYNQVWGVFSLPFILVFGFAFLLQPRARTGALAAGFLALGAFAYPLMLPFPGVALGLCGLLVWRRDRKRGERPAWLPRLALPAGRRGLAVGIALAVLAAPAVAVVSLGVYEKGSSALGVIAPGSDLSGWNALPIYLPFHMFFGLVDPVGLAWAAVAGLIVLGALGLWQRPREVGLPLMAMCGGALAFAAYFKARDQGAFFYFKVLGFAGPMVLLAAVVALSDAARTAARTWVRGLAVAGLAGLAASTVWGAKLEDAVAGEQFSAEVLALRDWSARIPAASSVLLAVPGGTQLNAQFMLSAHPVSSPSPFGSTTFPYPPYGIKADYLLTAGRGPRALRAYVAGPPAFQNRSFRLYRLRPGLPGRDTSSQATTEEPPPRTTN